MQVYVDDPNGLNGLVANSVCFGMESQCNSQKRKSSPQTAEDIFGEVSRGQAMMLVKKLVSVIGYMLWIALVAPVARPHVSVLW